MQKKLREVYGEEETHEFPEKSIELHDMEDPSNGRNEESKKVNKKIKN